MTSIKTPRNHNANRHFGSPQLPKFWRPKLDATRQLTAKVIHWDLIDRFTSGSATGDDLWDWMETGFTYSQILRMLHQDGTAFTAEAMGAICDQLDIYASVCARYRDTGRVGFSGPELCIARAAAHVMDALIELDRHGIAERAASWSTQQTARMRGQYAAGFLATAAMAAQCGPGAAND